MSVGDLLSPKWFLLACITLSIAYFTSLSYTWIVLLALAFPFSYWFYYWFFSPPFPRKFPGFTPKSETFQKHRAKVFPPPYPNGWFKIATLDELTNGKIKSVSAFGEEFVVYLGQDNKPVIMDAYCPHQGAHLGGGKVKDGCIQCPFHEWEFNNEGKACKIPYFTGKKIPDFAKTKVWPVRVLYKFVYVWYHADGEPPSWDFIDRSYWEDTKSWYYWGCYQGEFDMHIMEMAENSPDYAHFNVLHKPLSIPFFGRFFSINFHDFEMTFDPDHHHVHYFSNKADMEFCGKKLESYPPQETFLSFEGPGIVCFHLNTIYGKVQLWKNLLPVAPFKTYNEDHLFAETTVPRWFLYIYGKLANNALEQDRPIWNSKTFRSKPIIVQGDGPWPAHRRWWNQFYSKGSVRLAGSEMEDW